VVTLDIRSPQQAVESERPAVRRTGRERRAEPRDGGGSWSLHGLRDEDLEGLPPPGLAYATGPANGAAEVRRDVDGRRRLGWERRYQYLVLGSDVAASVAAVSAAGTLWGASPEQLALALLLVPALWALTVLAARGYEFRRLGSGPEEYQAVGRAAVTWFASLAAGAFLLDVELDRGVAVMLPVAIGLGTTALRWSARRLLHRRRREGGAMLRTLLVADPASADDLARMLARRPEEGFGVVGACLRRSGDLSEDVPVLGPLWDVPAVVERHGIDVVLVANAALSGEGLRRLSWALEQTSARLVVSPGVVEVMGPRVHVRPVAGLSLLHLESVAQNRGRLLGKAVLDRLLGTALLVLALPVLLLSAAAVRLTSRGPALFTQERVGRNGQPFTMYKLRTMRSDAEELRAGLTGSNERDGLAFKMREDPRVTPLGRYLRRYSLDELPQLINVVVGDMSLVGPRPPLPSEAEHYRDSTHRRLVVRPGLTGLWQVSGRADLSWEESVTLDLRYVDNWSITLDLQILWRTLRAVFAARGAY
jgi:exopolysaccharide biosynthesis polyprenyl glycosylphosphotransferase